MIATPSRGRAVTWSIAGLAIVVLLAAAGAAAAQDRVLRVHRIGFIASGSLTSSFDEFRQALEDLGYVEGKNVVIEARFAGGRSERLPELVAETIKANPDVLVVGSTPAALAAKRATTTIPIVFASLFDPVGAGLVQSLARPGGNVTGASIAVGGSGLGGKWLELLKEAVPGMSHVAVLSNPTNPANAASVREIEAVARPLGMKVDVLDARGAAKLDRALTTIAASAAQGIIVTNDPFFTASRSKLVRFAESKRLPATYFFRVFAEAGGLIVYGASVGDSYRKAAAYVDKVLRGARPGELPVEQPTRFELVVNMKTARALGIAIPPSLLLRADEIIE